MSGSTKKWWVCGVLLLASAINYMDRQTLANAAVRITQEFELSQEQYGNLELGFGWAFAAGSLLFGFLADKVPVRWLYPVVLALWSAVGFGTGLVQSYDGLIVCRTLLGLFEAGHWPCALKTTQRLLEPEDRTLGNSVLQSGTSIGAILTPILMSALMGAEPGAWRFPFQLVGALGLVWILCWFAVVKKEDLPMARPEGGAFWGGATEWVRLFLSRRFIVLVSVIVCINTTWQLLRAWLPKFLQEGRGYSETAALYFNSGFFVASDVGCLGAGVMSAWLFHRRGFSVHGARVAVFSICGALTALTTLAGMLPASAALLAVLLAVAVGALGLFPCYYALSQELSKVHQGMITGVTGVFAWALSAPVHKFFGRLVDRTGSFDLGVAVIGWLPAVALLALVLGWPKDRPTVQRL